MIKKTRLRVFLAKSLYPHGKTKFLKSIIKEGKLLDVGCGNNSPFRAKQIRSDIHYTGLDVDVYKQILGYEKYADRLIFTCPENFHLEIEKFNNEFDAVLSSHNLEHCDNYNEVLMAMIQSLKKKGKIYLAFPCEKSVTFPKRRGTLNFYDDITHKNIISFDETIELLEQNNIAIDFSVRQEKPWILSTMGFIFEPISKILNLQVPFGSTWAYYGFETIIIGHKM